MPPTRGRRTRFWGGEDKVGDGGRRKKRKSNDYTFGIVSSTWECRYTEAAEGGKKEVNEYKQIMPTTNEGIVKENKLRSQRFPGLRITNSRSRAPVTKE